MIGKKGGSMDDLISRQEIIRLILERGLYCDTQADREISAEIIRQLPSAQPETHDKRTKTHSCDCISRQAAIDAVGSMLRRKFGIGGDLAEITLAGLPSTQPETHDKRTETHACDCISRQAAIDAVENIDCSDGVGISALKCEAVDDGVTAIKALPSAQPEKVDTPTVDTPNCDDTISRPDGYWMRMSDLNELEDDRYKCSCCGNVVHHRDKVSLYTYNSWCGACGANMNAKNYVAYIQ